MIIRKVLIENFRAYKNIDISFNKGINVIIGKNDVGKSTILEALDIFFGQSRIKIDISDKCVYSSGNIAITVVFEIDKDKEYLIDSDVRTNLVNEFLLNKEGYLEIRKEWDCSKEKLTASSLKTSLKAFYPKTFSDNPLPTLKITDLKKLLEDKNSIVDLVDLSEYLNNNEFEGIDIESYDPDSNKKPVVKIDNRKRADIRGLLYKLSNNSELCELSIPMDKEDGKNIYQALESDFPQYELFQSDRENKDNEKDVQDPLKVITRKVIKEQQSVLDKISKELEERVEEISNQTLEKLKEMNPELAKELSAELHSKDWASLFDYSFTSDSGIPLNKRGSGIRRLVLLNFFRAEAENRNTSTNNTIYALEEPETSQHADNQKMIMKAFKEIAQKPNHQVFITTHSNNLIKMVQPDEITFIKKGETQPVIVESDNVIYEVAKDLGTLPSLNSNVVILVEGITDKYFLENINQLIPEYKEIIDLNVSHIPLFWVGGSNVSNWVDTRPLQSQNIVEFHLYDSDGKDHYKTEIDKINDWGNGSFAIQTNLPTIENYIHPDIVILGKEDGHIQNYFESNLSNIQKNIREKWNQDKWTEIKSNWKNTIDVSKELTNIGYSKVKNYFNEYLVNMMTKDLLIELGAFDEIRNWFLKIKELNDKYN
ncbi:hypothetical protein CYCD_20700 [Tenuifilaceae bacterium CYCD]|nr:hypothetical protein CYCD_20700 [Tenuifilaceae bacterium CYCD]